jgi:hypothetical protein
MAMCAHPQLAARVLGTPGRALLVATYVATGYVLVLALLFAWRP